MDISLTVSPVRNAQGTIVGASKIVRDISERKRLDAALGRQREKLGLMNRLGVSLGGELDSAALIQAVTDAGRELSGAAFGAFFHNEVNEKGESYTLYTLSGAPREAFEHFGIPRNTEIFGPTFRGEGVVRIGDVLTDPRYGKLTPHHGMPKGHLSVRSYLAVPVLSRSGEVIGGLFFGHPEPDAFTEDSEELLLGLPRTPPWPSTTRGCMPPFRRSFKSSGPPSRLSGRVRPSAAASSTAPRTASR